MEYIYEILRCMHYIETMCHEKGRQLLLVGFFELSALDLVPYSKPCMGHNSETIWNIFMKIYRCMHDIEAMFNEHGRQLLLIWFMNYLPLTTYVTFFLVSSYSPLSIRPLSFLPLSFISAISFLPFSGRQHKMTHKA